MISAMEEIRACKEVIIEAKQSLTDEGIDFAEDLPLGVMIEVPAAVHLVPRLAREVDFFALGTNDLVQYLLAADRNNPLVSRHYDPLHPAALDAIGDVCRAARAADRDLCLCGEMATDPLTLLPLLGMGLREFSMPAPFIPRIKAFLRGVNMKNAARCLEDVAQMDTSSQIRDHLQGVLAASESAA